MRMRPLNLVLLGTLVLLVLALWRLAQEGRAPTGCEMTYMYSTYVPVPTQAAELVRQRYKLYLYREDGFNARQGARGNEEV